ncbi:heterokaryon incompatibility protein-domain-containing protein [Paraphoma chrysanthemicola]|nr:heterokaryon incompatibility protein-domain-containing protein [Paraphoma chrysanthemicola]
MSALHATDSADLGGADGNRAATADLSALVGLPPNISHWLRPSRADMPEEPLSRTNTAGRTDRSRKISKACDRCRLKRVKCRGEDPCNRCQSDKAICVRGKRRARPKPQKKFPAGADLPHRSDNLLEDEVDGLSVRAASFSAEEVDLFRDIPLTRSTSPLPGPSTSIPFLSGSVRSTSPQPYDDNDWSRSQSPSPSLHSDDVSFFETDPLPEAEFEGLSLVYHSNSAFADTRTDDSEALIDSWLRSPGRWDVDSLNCEDLLSHKAANLDTAAEARGTELQPYEYSPIPASSVRLLRISPGRSSDPIICALRPISIDRIKDSVLSFQALSYAWGRGMADKSIALYDLPGIEGSIKRSNNHEDLAELVLNRSFFVRENLYDAMIRLRQPNQHTWLWIDAICIDQGDEIDKSEQIPNMPDIYSAAWNVIVWLGEWDGNEEKTQLAVALLPRMLNLTTLDAILDKASTDEVTIRSWVAFGCFLQSPWFSRRWVIQEIACAMRLCVRVQGHILSWLDFTDAIDIYLHNLNRIQHLIEHSSLPLHERRLPSAHACTRVAALLHLSRNCFRKGPDSKLKTRLMSLEDLVIAAAPFNVSEIRDTVYALLYLASDRSSIAPSGCDRSDDSKSLSSDYSRHAVDIYSDFITHCIRGSQSLDIIYRPWATWPHKTRGRSYLKRTLPSWIGVASFGDDEAWSRIARNQVLLGTSDRPLYNTSRGAPMQLTFITDTTPRILHARGIILGTVRASTKLIKDGFIWSYALRLLGWTGNLDNGVDDSIWKTLVANRTSAGSRAPAWYRRACALALTKLNPDGDMDIAAISARKGQASTMMDYLQRVRTVVEDRKVFQYTAGLSAAGELQVGLGPFDLEVGDLVCILYGCSVPVLLRQKAFGFEDNRAVRLKGMCYVHDNMEGEIFASMTQDEINERTVEFEIY